MSWKPVLNLSEPTELAVSLDEIKAQLRVTSVSEDGLLTRLVRTATDYVELFCGTRLVSRAVLLQASSFHDLVKLPVGPITEITSIGYLDPSSVEAVVDAGAYVAELQGIDPSIRLVPEKSWPSILPVSDAIRIEAVAGYGTAADVPPSVGHAIILLVSQWYDNRSTFTEANVNKLPHSIRSLLTSYRRRP